MNDRALNRNHFFNQIVFIIVVFTMVIQPATQTFAFFTQSNYGLVNYDSEKDTKKEKKEKDGKDEKIEVRFVSDYSYLLTHKKNSLCLWTQSSICDVHLEIHIPPPEQV